MNLPTAQQVLLSHLYRFGATRTDVLATAYGHTPSEAAHVMLPLREAGLVTTTNDGNKYVLWCITQEGVDVLLNNSKKYIVWSPQGSTPPEKVHNNQAAAEMAAKAMASRYPGQQFFVCEVQHGHQYEKPTLGRWLEVAL
jgi:hypothetical protein